MAILKVTVEYTIGVADTNAANLMADLLLKTQSTSMGSDNWSIWEWSPQEKITDATVEDK